ncbi:MICAL-2 protein [Thecamonas trahens ATCC 50062]|uniref:MICAL-2 protein n=1 Tax=Thecamonas trahens ATCC 50062 TaxID=461836 RepID=A0A0L0DV16_THETB|nr:MICAL-2 protein [Thecamonas trahens ATCC 50062]KNC56134.1 MICAL-2 protein [Thecamonas trahens ATCC 50062]|eukprot:XP_013761173.1 MICAL-2 protein [Thecamonas trahens ATCC 50062]
MAFPSPAPAPALYDAPKLAKAFYSATTFANTLSTFAAIAHSVGLDDLPVAERYPVLRDACFGHMRLRQIFRQHLDPLRAREGYASAPCTGMRVLVLGAGPGGLRTAIEAAVLGAEVLVAEKRHRFSRHNVLHLWKFMVADCQALGVKALAPRFCRGGLNHVSIKALQLALTKIALLAGAVVVPGQSVAGVSAFDNDRERWHVEPEAGTELAPRVADFDFDVVVGGCGSAAPRLRGFTSSTFRANVAIGITANFVRRGSAAESKLHEIPGIGRQYHPQVFNAIEAETGVALENLVYYQDETHYFVMTVSRDSLVARGAVIADLPSIDALLARDNIDCDALHALCMDVALAATRLLAGAELPEPEFALTARGAPDVAVFDFTEISYLDASARVELARRGSSERSLILAHVGDALLEPFWPQGTGASRAFLSALDLAHMLVRLAGGTPVPEALEERERVYALLSSTTDGNIRKTFASHTHEPASRYDFVPPPSGRDVSDLITSV